MPQHKAEQQRESPKASGTGATGSHLEAQAAKNSNGLGVSGGHRFSKPKRFTVERFVLLGENMNIQELAKEMNVSESDASAFVECLKVWINKGYSLEQAIAKHMQQMQRMVNEAYDAMSNPAKTEKRASFKQAAAEMVWDAVN